MADRCRSCDAAIEWAKSATTGKAIALDLAPVADGNLVVIKGLVHAAKEMPGEQLRKSHFATCPQAGQWRKK